MVSVRRGLRWARTPLVALLVVVVLVAAHGGAAGERAGTGGVVRPVTHPASGRYTRLSASALAAALSPLYQAQTVARRLVGAPGMPTCTPPPVPAATYPPGHPYGVPFLAAITGGELLTGYDEWTADHTKFHASGQTYTLYPWQSKVFDITGWVTGLLELPDLSAQIPASDIVFCDNGGAACVSASPPAGQCIHVSLGGQPEPKTPPFPPITNDPPPGEQCQGAPYCIPYMVTLNPVGTSTLTVVGVESDGALDLKVTTSATTTASLTEGTTTQLCTNAPTTISLSTVAPSGLPATAPAAPTAPNPDDRGIQSTPVALHGPLAGASSTVSGDDFSVPAFAYPPTAQCATSGLSDTLNAPLGGWDLKGHPIYYENPPAAIAGLPGWNQFTATTTVSTIDLPVGPPPGFNF